MSRALTAKSTQKPRAVLEIHWSSRNAKEFREKKKALRDYIGRRRKRHFVNREQEVVPLSVRENKLMESYAYD